MPPLQIEEEYERCNCPHGPTLRYDPCRGESICVNCGLVISMHELDTRLPHIAPSVSAPVKTVVVTDHFQRVLRRNKYKTNTENKRLQGEFEIGLLQRIWNSSEFIGTRAIYLVHKSLSLFSKTPVRIIARVCFYYAALEGRQHVLLSCLATPRYPATYLRQFYCDFITRMRLPPVQSGWDIYLEKIASQLKLPASIIATGQEILTRIGDYDRANGYASAMTVAGALYLGAKQQRYFVNMAQVATAAKISPQSLKCAIQRIVTMCGAQAFTPTEI